MVWYGNFKGAGAKVYLRCTSSFILSVSGFWSLLILCYLAHSAYGECNVFTLSVPPSVHKGKGSGQLHYLANVPGIEPIVAIKLLMPRGGAGKCTIWLMSQKKCSCPVISQNAIHVAYISIMHCSLPVISLLTCCQKEVLKACTCLYSQAARHSGILPPPPRA